MDRQASDSSGCPSGLCAMNRRGITGFATEGPVVPHPASELKAFSRACHEVARRRGARVVDLVGASTTPSFHLARLDAGGRTCAVLCNATLPVLAFADVPVQMGSLRFRDEPALRREYEQLGYECPTAAELERPARVEDLDQLEPVELDQIRYWNPARLGDVAFNWFD